MIAFLGTDEVISRAVYGLDARRPRGAGRLSAVLNYFRNRWTDSPESPIIHQAAA